MRIGQGFDVHAFAPDRPLVIGGMTIPHEQGLAGHSDADVLVHALCDALLGAAALGDIGMHFPDTDDTYRNVDSRKLLRHVLGWVSAAGWEPENVDVTLIAQRPRMAPHIPGMVACLAADLELSVTAVNIKATTTEHLGFTGREEGIAAMAVCLLKPLG